MNHALFNISKKLLPQHFLEDKKQFHVTFAFLKGKMVAIGTNKLKTHPCNIKIPYYDEYGESFGSSCHIHSEIDCWLKLRKLNKINYKKLTFYNIRISPAGKILLSKPCNGCLAFFTKLGYKYFYYTNQKGEFVQLTV